MSKMQRVGLVGARGYVGRELMQLLAGHPGFEISWASSREKYGQPLAADVPGLTGGYCLIMPERLPQHAVDTYVLALPNGLAESWVAAIEAQNPQALIIDLSADYRFASGWQYGLPEFNRSRLSHSRRISNPGCYATAMQLAIQPVIELPLAAVHCFGVSGYSGAGSKPSPNNDPERLTDNLKAYRLIGHVHEQEVSYQLQHAVRFMPAVAGFFRGIQITASMSFDQPISHQHLDTLLADRYAGEAFVDYQQAIPEIREIRGTPQCCIGGLQVSEDGRHAVLVSVLDNLLKGAASQALQNLNLACGFNEKLGINHD